MARNMFSDLGSNFIQNFLALDRWYIVTQKGIDGFTPFEEVEILFYVK